MTQNLENEMENKVLDDILPRDYNAGLVNKESSKKKLLIVDDEESYLATYMFALQRKCSEIDLATNEKDGLEMIAENNYDAVITDGAMPEFDNAYFGGHGNIGQEDYRGKNIAKVAKERGAYVIGITSEPEKLDCESIDVLMKKPYDVLELFLVLALQPTKDEYERLNEEINVKD